MWSILLPDKLGTTSHHTPLLNQSITHSNTISESCDCSVTQICFSSTRTNGQMVDWLLDFIIADGQYNCPITWLMFQIFVGRKGMVVVVGEGEGAPFSTLWMFDYWPINKSYACMSLWGVYEYACVYNDHKQSWTDRPRAGPNKCGTWSTHLRVLNGPRVKPVVLGGVGNDCARVNCDL